MHNKYLLGEWMITSCHIYFNIYCLKFSLSHIFNKYLLSSSCGPCIVIGALHSAVPGLMVSSLGSCSYPLTGLPVCSHVFPYLFFMLLLDDLANLTQIDRFSLKAFSTILVEWLDFPCALVYAVQMVIMAHTAWHLAAHIYTSVMLYLTANPPRADTIIYLLLSLILILFNTVPGPSWMLSKHLLNKWSNTIFSELSVFMPKSPKHLYIHHSMFF